MLSKAQILDHVWNYDFNGEANVVESYISYLRRKIDTTEPRLLHTIRGVGLHLAAAPRDVSRDSDAPRPGRTPAPRVPLRITLVALLVALVAVGLLATGFAATSLLRGYLLDQRDAELRAAVRGRRARPAVLGRLRRPGSTSSCPGAVVPTRCIAARRRTTVVGRSRARRTPTTLPDARRSADEAATSDASRPPSPSDGRRAPTGG